uniref:Putative trypsin-like serine protease n=1 Tax=Anopheles marajoara TaxID=58244 RepID=A0A2M4BUH7_9DIPT
MKQSVKLIWLVLAVILFGGHFAKAQQNEVSDVGQENEEVESTDAAESDEQNNQPSDSNRVGRIINGISATSANQPYLVTIVAYIGEDSFYFIGALISNTEVLTSASTLKSAGDLSAVTFSLTVGSNPSISSGITYSDKGFDIHSGFNPTTLANDVAIIKINGNLSGLANVRPIAIATTEIAVSTTNRTQCVVAGWKDGSNDIGETTYELLTDQECAAAGANPPSIVCARKTGTAFACNFDGGAPLVCNGQLYGILTDQTGCSGSSPPVLQKFAKLPVISIPWNTPIISTPNATIPNSNASLPIVPRKNYVSCP